MSSRILGANRGLEWHRAVAPGVEVGEITTHGLALSRPRRGFESRWSHHTRLLRPPKLPRDPDQLIVGQGPTRDTECAAAEPGEGGGGAPRGWAPSRIPPASGVSRWDEKVEGTA